MQQVIGYGIDVDVLDARLYLLMQRAEMVSRWALSRNINIGLAKWWGKAILAGYWEVLFDWL